MNVDSGAVTTIAGKQGPSVINYPNAVAFSPDGLAVVVAEDQGKRVQLITVATGALTVLTTGSDNIYGIAWSPRSTNMVFATYRRHQLFVLNGPGCDKCYIGKVEILKSQVQSLYRKECSDV